MALALSVQLGSIIYIDEVPATITEWGNNKAVVKYKGVEHLVSVSIAAFIEPNVKVFVGLSAGRLSRLCFEAPRAVTILRDKLHDHQKNTKNPAA